MIYLDTNIFIYPISGTDVKSATCGAILDKVFKGEEKAGTSCLTWDEFQYALKKVIGKENAIASGAILINSPNLTFFKTDLQVIQKAQTITEEYGIAPRDAIHAATAMINNCSEIVSDDPDFDKIKGLKRRKIN
ncbi:MAG: type II toxin-antitoxin system VapC family toxin [Nanoarchaeota archaeon]